MRHLDSLSSLTGNLFQCLPLPSQLLLVGLCDILGPEAAILPCSRIVQERVDLVDLLVASQSTSLRLHA